MFGLINPWAAEQAVPETLQEQRWLSALPSLAPALPRARYRAGAGTHPPCLGNPQSPLIPQPHWRHSFQKVFFPMALVTSPVRGKGCHSFHMVAPLIPTKCYIRPLVLPTIPFITPNSTGPRLYHVLKKKRRKGKGNVDISLFQELLWGKETT